MTGDAIQALEDRIENDFKYHSAALDPDASARHAKVRNLCKDLALQLIDLVPIGREQSLAITSLEQVMMWANAGIARRSAS